MKGGAPIRFEVRPGQFSPSRGVLVHVAVHHGVILAFAAFVATNAAAPWWQVLALALAAGHSAGVGAIASHEIGHRHPL